MTRRLTRPLLAALLLAAAIVVPVGCGGGDDDDDVTPGSPASLTPAGVPFYAETVAKPEGEQKEALEAILDRFPDGSEIDDELIEMFETEVEESSETDETLTYAEDIEPWLGARAGFFIVTGEDGGAEGTFLVQVTDEDEANAAAEKALEIGGVETEDVEYEGITYKTDAEETEETTPTTTTSEFEGEFEEDGFDEFDMEVDEEPPNAVAVFDGFLVVGTEEGVKAAIDVSAGNEDALGDSDEFTGADAAVGGSDALGYFYLDADAFLDILPEAEGTDPAEIESVRSAAESAGINLETPFAASLTAESDSIAVEASVGVTGEAPPISSPLIGELPADSSLAFAVADLGASLDAGLELLSVEAQSDEFAADPLEEIERRLGIDPVELAGSIGDAAVFTRGTTLTDLGGGIVFEVTDEATVSDALRAARERIEKSAALDLDVKKLYPGILGAPPEGFALEEPGQPEPFNVALRDDRLVLAYGDEATDEALNPSETLTESGALTPYEEGLGEGFEPTLVVDISELLALAEGLGASADVDYAQAEPYLEPLALLAAGAAAEGDRLQGRIVLTLD